MEPTVNIKRTGFPGQSEERGFSLLEVMISMAILTVGLLAVLATLGFAISATQTSQEDIIARQLASEAMETIFTARNTSQIPFSSIANTTAIPPGIFLTGSNAPKCPGPDGILDTIDDVNCLTASGAVCPNGGVECLTEAGPDGIIGTADDTILSLNNYARTIAITPLNDANGNVIPTLVQVTITVNYTVPNHGGFKSYVLDEYISAYH